MKILLVGGTSALGRALAPPLAAQAHVVTTARDGQGDIELDLANWAQAPQLSGEFDALIQVAADFGGAQAEDFLRCEQVNAVGTLAVCRLAERLQVRHYVQVSSIFATYQLGDPYYGIYALSKRHGEELAQLFCADRAIPLTILRPSQVYDAHRTCEKHQRLLYTMADCAHAGRDITIFGSHDARRNYLYLDDLVEVCARILAAQVTGVYNCAHPQDLRLSEMAQAAFEAFGHGGQLRFLSEHADIPDLPLMCGDDIYPHIGYTPQVDITEGYRRIKHSLEQPL